MKHLIHLRAKSILILFYFIMILTDFINNKLLIFEYIKILKSILVFMIFKKLEIINTLIN